MKRSALLAHLLHNGAIVVREGRRHTIVGMGRRLSEVPRHREVVDRLARKICRDLGLPFVR
jgi:mRNA interferase HicA